MRRGFTLIELLVVLAIVALMLTLAAPRYVDRVERARETALKTDLRVIREAIDHFADDQGRLPRNLGELVERSYLKEIPVDPMTDQRDSWVAVSESESAPASLPGDAVPPSSATVVTRTRDGVTETTDAGELLADVRSGAPGRSRDGSLYRDW